MGAIQMPSNSDLEVRKREISALVEGVNDAERRLALPEIEGFEDYDRLEAMDIINRIERRMMAKMPMDQREAAE